MINTLFLTTVAVEPTLVAFHQHSRTYVRGLSCHSFQFLWRTGQTKPPTIPFGIVLALFPTTFLKTAVYGERQLLVWKKTVMHINKREDSGRHQRGLISSFYDYCPFSKKFVSHNSRQKKEDKVGHKTVHKKERQRKKRERERKIEIHSEKIFKFRLVGMREKQKSCLFTSKQSESMLFLLHSYANQPKTSPKKRNW